jgi:hypothetical protein
MTGYSPSAMASSSPIPVNGGETAKIDPDGDVLLQVGSSSPHAHLLISSKVLSLASPVFAAMLSPPFKEGSSLSSGHGCEILLPEDDPGAMALLCSCLHFRTDQIPTVLEFPLLKALAILCDKYDCTKAISAWIVLWLRRWETDTCEEGFEELLFVVYALDCAAAFAEISRRAILEQVGSFYDRRVIEEFHMVPENLLGTNLLSLDILDH